MLTIKSKFNNFKNRLGEFYTDEDLTMLSRAIITSDIIHFKGNISYGFNSNIADCIYKYIDKKDKNGKILIINDLSLHMINKLIDEGFDINNIYLAYGKWTKNADIDKDLYVYETMKKHIEVSFKESLNIIKLEDIFNMQFDLVIANPPYGRIGAQITKKIIDEVDYKDFINLLPANDYLKADGVFNYVKTIEHIPGFGEDANVLPTICEIVKNNLHNYSKLDIYTKLSSNDLTYKYFSENNKRENVVEFDEDTTIQDLDFSDKLIFGVKVSANAKDHSDSCNIQGSAKGIIYAINNKFKTLADHYAKRKSKALWGVILKFNSSIERDNAFKFIYSDESGRFCNMLITSMHKDNMHAREHSYWFPKVDWTREWTTTQVLIEYGYTQDEIDNVIVNLNNYKGVCK